MERSEFYNLCLLHIPELYQIWHQVFSDSHPHHLALSSESTDMVAYSPEGVSATDDKRRRKTTFGRYLTRQLGVKITPSIEKGINKVLAITANEWKDGEAEFEVLRGDAVTAAYVDKVGCHSCMVGEECKGITEWFSLFEDKIGLVVWRKTKGRALLWTLDDGRLSLDRIYAGNRTLAEGRYDQWRIDNSVEYRASGVITLGRIAVDGRQVPYLDTYYYADDKGRLSNDRGLLDRPIYTLQDTDGHLNGGYICDRCGSNDDDSYCVDGRDWCYYCMENYSFCCNSCDQYHDCEDSVEVEGESVCERCSRNSTECSHCDYRMWDDNVQELEGTAYCDDCYSERAEACERCNEHVHRNNTSEVAGQTWCYDCVKDHSCECSECGDVVAKDSECCEVAEVA